MPHKLFSIFSQPLKPPLFEPGEPRFWDDPYISKSMLEAHLNQTHDGASRKNAEIEKTVCHLITSGFLKTGDRVLDLGCGPGLYSSRLCFEGMKVTGIDLSRRSIDYARAQADRDGHDIDYICADFFNIDYEGSFDAVLQVYGEICTFSDDKRDMLLSLVRRSLKDDGIFIFDVSTRELRVREGLKNRWYFSEGGFWRPGRHFVLEEGFDYPENDTWLNQYIIVDEDETVKVYRLWLHDYSLEIISWILEKNGFKVEQAWNSLSGELYSKGGDWIAIAVRKVQ
ncbi:methyltransferase domain-containing protein [Methanosarcina sp. DH1]|uniref:class I SAM-dependent methyltransferase n=1 Tax=Methanosarcina sp. DH1 TaxID=2605695 RepID=UPI001E4DE3B5|nr:methyltransferase domain-containing protein [Methanosarcina sp. DH1]MCC4767057.1 methyltransferase domain-containing protein [Methanosarcina sp. DH1]